MEIIILIIIFLIIKSFVSDINDFIDENKFTIIYVIGCIVINIIKLFSYEEFPLDYTIFTVVVFIMIKIFEKVRHFFQGYLAISALIISILSFFSLEYTTIAFLVASAIFVIMLLVTVGQSILKKINKSKHRFTIYYALICVAIAVTETILYKALPLHFAIFAVVVYILAALFGKIDGLLKGCVLFTSAMLFIQNLFEDGFIKTALLIAAAISAVLFVLFITFVILKKINKFNHKFTIYYVLICAVIAVAETILYKALPLNFLIFAVVVYLLATLLGKIDSLFKWCILITSALLFIQNLFEDGFIKTALLIVAAIPVVLFVLGILAFIIAKKSYKSRIEEYIAEYINNISNDNDSQNEITEASFFSQENTKKLLQEDFKVNGVSAEEFMKSTLRKLVIDGIKKEFMIDMDESKNKVIGSIYFYYNYVNFLDYLEEQNMSLTEIIDSFGILNTEFWYIKDVAFFSDLLLQELMSAFEQKLKTVPKLAEVPFSKEFLLNYMYSNKFLDCYLSETYLDCLRNNPGLFKEEYDDLYSAMTEIEIDTSIKKKLINKQSAINEKDDYLYSVIHEDEDGIIKEEYGKDFEQHRDYLDEDLSANQIDELAGCPV